MSRQKSVEKLLIEVRDEYSRAMKKAIIDYKRRQPGEEEKLAHLGLLPLDPDSVVPYLAVISLPPRPTTLKELVSSVGEAHYTIHPEATQVILALYRSWDQLKKSSFLDVQAENMNLPMQLFEYDDHQNLHFSRLRDKVCCILLHLFCPVHRRICMTSCPFA
jgi:hypothetical protein